jgi:hypothetical protein
LGPQIQVNAVAYIALQLPNFTTTEFSGVSDDHPVCAEHYYLIPVSHLRRLMVKLSESQHFSPCIPPLILSKRNVAAP